MAAARARSAGSKPKHLFHRRMSALALLCDIPDHRPRLDGGRETEGQSQ
jgi:hypothetical protein